MSSFTPSDVTAATSMVVNMSDANLTDSYIGQTMPSNEDTETMMSEDSIYGYIDI